MRHYARYSENEERVSERRIRRHLAGRYNVKAKWEKLLAEKEVRLVSWFEILWPILLHFLARDSMLSALYAVTNPSVHLSVRHMGGSVEHGWISRS